MFGTTDLLVLIVSFSAACFTLSLYKAARPAQWSADFPDRDGEFGLNLWEIQPAPGAVKTIDNLVILSISLVCVMLMAISSKLYSRQAESWNVPHAGRSPERKGRADARFEAPGSGVTGSPVGKWGEEGTNQGSKHDVEFLPPELEGHGEFRFQHTGIINPAALVMLKLQRLHPDVPSACSQRPRLELPPPHGASSRFERHKRSVT